MRRIQISPRDVRVVGRPGGPPPTGLGARLRKARLRIAIGIAAVELLAVAFAHLNFVIMIAVSLVLLMAHFRFGRRLRSYLLRQVSWTLALSQAFVAILTVALPIGVFAITIVLVVGLLIAVMLMLGDRR